MRVDQRLKAEFKAVFLRKCYLVEAHYTARRGTDVATLIKTEAPRSQGSRQPLRPAARSAHSFPLLKGRGMAGTRQHR
jgi:hypothetical protein